MTATKTAITPDELLEHTAIGCGWHEWGVEGGSIRVTTEQLRPVLEQAYDPNMPDWVALVDWDDDEGDFHVA